MPKRYSAEVHERVLDDIGFCLSQIIPNAVELEDKYWALTDFPDTAGQRFATLNVGPLEVAYFPRKLRNFSRVNVQEENYTCNLNLHRSVARDFKVTHPWTKSKTVRHFGLTTAYNLSGVGRLEIPVGQLRQFFTDVPEFLPYARRLALELMRQKDVSMFRRHHSRTLSKEVFELVQERSNV